MKPDLRQKPHLAAAAGAQRWRGRHAASAPRRRRHRRSPPPPAGREARHRRSAIDATHRPEVQGGAPSPRESPQLELGTRLWDSCWGPRPGHPAPAQRRRQACLVQPCSAAGTGAVGASRGGSIGLARQRALPATTSLVIDVGEPIWVWWDCRQGCRRHASTGPPLAATRAGAAAWRLGGTRSSFVRFFCAPDLCTLLDQCAYVHCPSPGARRFPFRPLRPFPAATAACNLHRSAEGP